MQLTKPQIQGLYNLLNFLTDDNADINKIKFMGGDIIVLAEPIKGEIENRGWKILPGGEVNNIPSFFHE